MSNTFYKYQGTGNDFILFDNRALTFPANNVDLIHHLCDRRMGIGADGLMLLQNKEGYDFEMVYYNSDGNKSSMCGNGGRCITAFARDLGIVSETANFIAIDGPHNALINKNEISLQMIDVEKIECNSDHYFLDTGSPHYVAFKDNVNTIDLIKDAQGIRYNERFKAEGTNVNFAHVLDNELVVRTYERGVEDETLSCGTGVTAVAIAALNHGIETPNNKYAMSVKGGTLNVKFDHDGSKYTNVWLIGPATYVFKGEVDFDGRS